MDTRTQRGFTLFELLVTILVAGVIFGLGVPNLLEFSRNNRMVATSNDFVAAMNVARSYAVTERTPVTLCASPNPVAATPTCSADASGTNGGYIVWVDADADADVDGGETVMLQRDDPVEITVTGDNGYVHFAANGRLANIAGSGNSATEILFCDDRGNVAVSGSLSAARGILISPTGRPDTLNEVADITALLAIACP